MSKKDQLNQTQVNSLKKSFDDDENVKRRASFDIHKMLTVDKIYKIKVSVYI